MFYELRQYGVNPGKRDAWVKLMEEEIIPFQVAKGMVILGSFVGQLEEGPKDDVYVWIRRFNSKEEWGRQSEAVYEDPHWKSVIGPKITGLLDEERITVYLMEPTPRSPLQ